MWLRNNPITIPACAQLKYVFLLCMDINFAVCMYECCMYVCVYNVGMYVVYIYIYIYMHIFM